MGAKSMRRVAAMMTAAMLAGCAATGGVAGQGAPVAIEGDAISYATEPCYGTCPVYSVSLRPDGRGTFVGERFTAVTGTREFTAPSATYRKLEALLRPYRPEMGERRIEPGTSDCANAPTDMPSIAVNWTSMRGDGQSLRFYRGCRAGNEALAAALAAVPDLLPIADFIGKR
jgi:hypothetical protein